MTDAQTRTTLVLGGTGKTGRRVAQRLTALGRLVRIGSRSGQLRFDWDDRRTWDPVLDGAGSVYILAVPGAIETVSAFAQLPAGRGARRQVLLSGRGEPEAELAEQAVCGSGAELTILRSTWFSQNFSEDYLLEPVLAGQVALPAGDTPEPFVDADDIAEVAVAALTQDGHVAQLYELTGPRLLTFAQAVDEIAMATGRLIRYVPISIDEYGAAAAGQGVPAQVIELLTYLFGEVLDGRNARVADGVQRVLGRQARDFTAFARDAAANGVWKLPAPSGEAV